MIPTRHQSVLENQQGEGILKEYFSEVCLKEEVLENVIYLGGESPYCSRKYK